MSTLKTVSYKQVLSKVDRDFGISPMNWKSMGIEWIGDALSAIGHSCDTEMVSCPVKVTNHRAPFPCNLANLLGIEYHGYKLPLSGTHKASDLSFTSVTQDPYNYSMQGFNRIDDEGGTPELTYANIQALPPSIGNQYYMLNPDYIITSFETDTIVIHYEGFVLDDEGYPKIPDSIEHKEALSWYILYKWLSRGNKHNTWGIKDAFQMWEKYLVQAQNQTAFPSIAEQERFTNMWCRIAMDNYEPDKFYKGAEQRQNIKGL
jgi:hypothetical protein